MANPSGDSDPLQMVAPRLGVRLVPTRCTKAAFLPGHGKALFVPVSYTHAQRCDLAHELLDLIFVTKSEGA